MSASPEKTITESLPKTVAALKLLAANKYCDIFEGTYAGERAVFKAYKSGDTKLVMLEAEGIDAYHAIAHHSEELMDSRVLALDRERRVIAISFVPGGRLADVLRELARNRDRWPEGFALMEKLGHFLAGLRRESLLSEEAPDPFHAEYIRYCSRRLRSLPLLGAVLFRNAEEEAESLIRDYTASRPKVSRAHGDFVFRNIHVENRRVGIIDLANTLRASHTLNDMENLRIALANMVMPKDFKSALWNAFMKGLGPLECSAAEAAFFHEYHRRRWLMLNLRSHHPVRWAKALLAMGNVAAPHEKHQRNGRP